MFQKTFLDCLKILAIILKNKIHEEFTSKKSLGNEVEVIKNEVEVIKNEDKE